MLCELLTLKERLGLDDTFEDPYLQRLMDQADALFDRHCNRNFARVEAATQEFRGDEVEISLARYPVELVIGFDLKTSEDENFRPVTNVVHVLRNGVVVSLQTALGTQWDQGLVTYTGGYVLPGTTPDYGQTALPRDVENAAIEQVAHWYRTRNVQGVASASGPGGSVNLDGKGMLLPIVESILEPYRRMQI